MTVLGKLLGKIQPLLAVLTIVAAVGLVPQILQSIRNREPVTLTLAEYLDHGSDHDWLVLTGCFVDHDSAVRLKYHHDGGPPQPGREYFPLRTDARDSRPVKVFLDPTSYMRSGGVLILTDGADAPPPGIRPADTRQPLQTVRGLRLRGWHLDKDVLSALSSSNVKTGEDLVIIEQNARPLTSGEVIGYSAAVLAPPTLLVLTFVFPRKRPS